MTTKAKARSTYKSGFCITGAHDSCVLNYGNETHPVVCSCDCGHEHLNEPCPVGGGPMGDGPTCDKDDGVRDWAQQAKDDYEFERDRERRLFDE